MRIVIDIGVRTVKQEQIYLGSKTAMIHNPEFAVILNVWDRDSTTKKITDASNTNKPCLFTPKIRPFKY